MQINSNVHLLTSNGTVGSFYIRQLSRNTRETTSNYKGFKFSVIESA